MRGDVFDFVLVIFSCSQITKSKLIVRFVLISFSTDFYFFKLEVDDLDSASYDKVKIEIIIRLCF